jgi:hypothetical protein
MELPDIFIIFVGFILLSMFVIGYYITSILSDRVERLEIWRSKTEKKGKKKETKEDEIN